MRELGLFEQYLIQLRQELLQRGHMLALSADTPQDFVHVRTTAHEAELCERLVGALRALANDPGQFIKEYLK
jgi:hypothetical protein